MRDIQYFMKTNTAITIFFLVLAILPATIAAQKQTQILLNSLKQEIVSIRNELNHQFEIIYQSKEYNYVFYELDSGKVTIGFSSKYPASTGKVDPQLVHEKDQYVDDVVKHSSKLVMVDSRETNLGPILRSYYVLMAKIVQFRILEAMGWEATAEQFKKQAEKIKENEDKRNQNKNQSRFIDKFRLISLQDFGRLFENQHFQGFKNISKSIKETIGDMARNIKDNFNELGEKIDQKFKKYRTKNIQEV